MNRRQLLKGTLAASVVTLGTASFAHRLNYFKGLGTDQLVLDIRRQPKPFYLAKVAEHCRNSVAKNQRIWATVREFIVANTRHPESISSKYYAAVTLQKNWDAVVADMWQHALDPSHDGPEVLCYDAADLMIMILAELGVEARSVRGIAANPSSHIGEYPMYLDHTFVEVWTGKKWSAQDPFYNVAYLLDQTARASADDLCAVADLHEITPRNRSDNGWLETGAHVLASQDFFAAIEHRDMTGESVVVMNSGRGNFDRLFKVSEDSDPMPLRELIVGSVVNKRSPTLVEFGKPSNRDVFSASRG